MVCSSADVSDGSFGLKSLGQHMISHEQLVLLGVHHLLSVGLNYLEAAIGR